MCGIAGAFDRRGGAEASRVTAEMAARLHHRGPDGEGLWTSASYPLALAHRRLSIIDLSAAGSQPMLSRCGRFVLSYNGEIYNFHELRVELEAAGTSFRGDSDTEVLLECIASFGVAATVHRLVGMFAFAVWDIEAMTMTLVRDRLGIKPLYWATTEHGWAFASEMNALVTADGIDTRLDPSALAHYLRFKYTGAPQTIYCGVKKLEPGCIAVFEPESETPRISRYWDAVQVAAAAQHDAQLDDPDEIDARLQDVLTDAVRRRMVADVPLGAFLSGGIDSSLICALMQSVSGRPVTTFSIGFSDVQFDESRFAANIAQHLGTEHQRFELAPDGLLQDAQRLNEISGEPFADVSLLPSLALCRETRRRTTVALSGDGGDELFAGYDQYPTALTLWRRLSMCPAPLRRALAAPMALADPGYGKWSRLRALLAARGLPAFYAVLLSQWQQPQNLAAPAASTLAVRGELEDYGPLCQLMLRDTTDYMVDDILHKVDLASMRHSLEVRVPLLDHRVFEFAWSLAPGAKRTPTEGKRPLRRLLEKFVPRNLFDRPKQGFDVPISAWLRADIRGWGEELLAESALRETRLFDVGLVRRIWQEHQSGRFDRGAYLWSILQLQHWLLSQGVRV